MTRPAHNSVLKAILLFFQGNLEDAEVPDLSSLDGQQQIAGGSGWRTDPPPRRGPPFGGRSQ